MTENTTVLTLDELAEESVKRNPSSVKSNILLEIICMVMGILFLVLGFCFEDTMMLRVAGFIMVGLALLDIPLIFVNVRNHNKEYIKSKILSASPAYEHGITYHYVFGEEAIHVTHMLEGLQGETDLKKENVVKVVKEEDTVFIYITKTQFYILKLNDNTEEEKKEIVQILSEYNK